MQRSLFITLLSVLVLTFASASWAAEEAKGSGLPIPRFVSLKSDEVNVRTGPGDRYPISWVYRRASLPVEITEEFDYWRKIKDFEGAEGWVHKGMLEGRRNVLIKGQTRTLRRAPDDSAAPLLRAEPMVVAKLLECTKEWCRVQVDSRKGWIKKAHIWGVYLREEFE